MPFSRRSSGPPSAGPIDPRLLAELAAAEDDVRSRPGSASAHVVRSRALAAVGRHDDAVDAGALAVSLVAGAGSGSGRSPGSGRAVEVVAGATAVARAVGLDGRAASWPEEAGVDPTAVDVVVATLPAPTVGPRIASLAEQDRHTQERWAAHHANDGRRRPSKVTRDASGMPLGIGTPAGMDVVRSRELPSTRASSVGLVVLAVLAVVMLAWFCTGPTSRDPATRGGLCGTSGLDLDGRPFTVDC